MGKNNHTPTKCKKIPFSWGLLAGIGSTFLALYVYWLKLHSVPDAQAGIAVFFYLLSLPRLFPLGLGLIWPLCDLFRLGWNLKHGHMNKNNLLPFCILPLNILVIALIWINS
jgi:hypothetical protein